MLTACDAAGNPHGLTVNSFTSVSAEPPLVLVCVDNLCGLWPMFEGAAYFGLSFLAEHQQDLSDRFAFVPERRFEGVGWRLGTHGCPLIDGALSWMECETRQQLAAGDHHIMIGEVVGAEASAPGPPLLYFGSGYRRLAP